MCPLYITSKCLTISKRSAAPKTDENTFYFLSIPFPYKTAETALPGTSQDHHQAKVDKEWPGNICYYNNNRDILFYKSSSIPPVTTYLIQFYQSLPKFGL